MFPILENGEVEDDGSEIELADDVSLDVPDTIADKKPSVRDAIKHAFEKEEAENTEDKTPSDKKSAPKKEAAADDGEDEVEDAAIDNEEVETPEIKTQEKDKQNQKAVAPAGWTKEAKAKWNTLPPEVQASVAKREKEVSDGFAKYGETDKKYKELDAVLAPHRAEIAKFNSTDAQTVDRLFKWMGALGHQDRNYAKQQFIQLGKNFGIDLTEAAPKQEVVAQTPEEIEAAKNSPETFLKPIKDELEGLKQGIAKQQQDTANQVLNNWAKDKPHFSTVRQYMFALLNSGAIPLKNGELDLDSAYDQATQANPTTRELVAKEKAEKAAQEAKAASDAKELARLKKVKAAQKAGVSIPNRAGSSFKPTNTPGNNKPNGKSAPSIRDSIRAAVKEVDELNS